MPDSHGVRVFETRHVTVAPSYASPHADGADSGLDPVGQIAPFLRRLTYVRAALNFTAALLTSLVGALMPQSPIAILITSIAARLDCLIGPF